MKKNVLPLLILIACIVCICFSTAVNAETVGCIIRGEKVVAIPGMDVTMNVTVENNPGISGAELSVSFGEDLELIGAEAGDAFDALTYTGPSYFKNPTTFVWDSVSLRDEDIKDGLVLTLTFRVADTAEGDLPVVISYVPGDVFDQNSNPLELTTINGTITALSYTPGDVDGNGRINPLDITLIRRYISDGRITDPNGYNVSINENAADVDGNGRINTLDITLIRRYISDGRVTDPDGYNVVLKPGKMSGTHIMQHTAAKEPTCETTGNIEYWYCTVCKKYFADAEGKYEILLANTELPKKHTFAEEWSYDESAHWHDVTCGHAEEVEVEVIDHTFTDHKCSVCGAEEKLMVTFTDDDGSVIDTQYVSYGKAAVAPVVPERLGYVFDRWNGSFDAVTEEITVTAQYVKAHIVTFADHDGRILKQQSVRDGAGATAYIFTQSDLPPEGYRRTGWDKAFDKVTDDIVVYATYERKVYTVTFYMPDGALIATQTVEHGSDAEAPDCDENYFDWNSSKMGSFSGWNHSLKNIRSDMNVYAQYRNECDQPVISIDTTADSASIKLYAPEGCYLYAIDFGFNWSGNISILSCDKNIASNLYKGNNGASNIDFNNKYDTFHYTWTNAAGVKLDGAYTTVLDIRFATDGSHVVNKDVLKLFNGCSVVYSTKQTSDMDELEIITPIVVIR